MATYKVRNDAGQDYDVDEANLSHAEKDGYLPVVSNGQQEHRVASKDMTLAAKDGYSPLAKVEPENQHDLVPFLKGAAGAALQGAGDIISGGLNKLAHPIDTANDVIDTVKGVAKDPMGDLEAMGRTARSIPILGQGIEEGAAALSAATGDKPFAEGRQDFLNGLQARDQQHREQAPIADFAQRNAGAAIPGMGAVLYNPVTMAADAGIRSFRQGNTITDALKDARNVGLLAGAPALGTKALGASGVTSAIDNFAENRAVKSLEPILRQQEKLNNMGQTNTLGRELLDSGVVGAGRSVNQMIDPLEKVLAEKGQAIGAARDLAGTQGATADLLGDAQSARMSAQFPGQMGHEAVTSGVLADNLSAVAKDGLNPTQMQGLVARANEGAGLSKVPGARTATEEGYNGLRQYLVGKMDESMAQKLSPEDMQAYLKNKETFSALKGGEEALDKAVARHAKNATFGLRDHLVGAGALKDAKGWKDAALMVGSKLTRERGNSTLAAGADKVSQLLKNNPAELGQFASVLGGAAARGGQALAATHYLLQQTNPEYRRTINGNEDEQDSQVP